MPESIDTNIRFASMRQIHEAIQHFHRGDWECAITLAAAGEGMLPDTDKPHFRQKAIALEQQLPKENGGTRANAYINWLKHGTFKTGAPRVENAHITELEVIYTIWRGITKFQAVYGDDDANRTPQMIRFANWLKEHLPNVRASE